MAPNLKPVLISNKSPSKDQGNLSPDEVVYDEPDIKTTRPMKKMEASGHKYKYKRAHKIYVNWRKRARR